MSYEQIASLLGISAVRVRQIEHKALQKLRRALLKAGVTERDVKNCGGAS